MKYWLNQMGAMGLVASVSVGMVDVPMLDAVAVSAQVPEKPAMACLDEDALFAVVAPNLSFYMEAMREQTQVGQMLFTDEKIEAFVALLREHAGAELGEAEDTLAEVGLTFEDLRLVLQGEMGFGGILVDRLPRAFSIAGVDPQEAKGQSQLLTLLAWCDVGDSELADKLFAAYVKTSELALADGQELERFDFEIDGHPVIQMSFPEYEWDWEEYFDDDGIDEAAFEYMEPERLTARYLLSAMAQMAGVRQLSESLEVGVSDANLTELAVFNRLLPLVEILPFQDEVQMYEEDAFDEEDWEDSYVEADRTHLLLTRYGNRLIVAILPAQSSELVIPLLPDDDVSEGVETPEVDLDWAALTGVDEVIEVLGRFLAAHEDDRAGFAGEVAVAAGMDQAVPVGVPAVIGYGNLAGLVQWGLDSDEDFAEMAEPLGLTDLSWMGFGFALDGAVMRTNGVMASPSPRRGVWSLLEQPSLSPTIPAWVPADTITYVHLSFDMADVYEKTKQLVLDTVGDEALEGFVQAEAGVEEMVGESLIGLLGTVEPQISLLNFESKVVMVEQPDWSQDWDPQTGEPPMVKVPVPQNRLAFVFSIRDSAPWLALSQAVAPFAAIMGDALSRAEELDFTGWRLENDAMPVSWMIGSEYMTICLGSEVTSTVLASLNSPSEPAWGRNAAVVDAAEMLDLKPGLYLGVQLLSEEMRAALNNLHEIGEFGGMSPMNMFLTEYGLGDSLFVEGLLELLPDADEFADAFGAAVAQMYLTDEALVIEGASGLAPSE